MMEPNGETFAVYANTVCQHEHCWRHGHTIGTQEAVAFQTPDGIKVMHIGCAPPKVRKAHYDFLRQEAARGR
jgi:hypothetical protein